MALDTSWKAEDRLRPLWDRVPVDRAKRDVLAERVGTSASNLSQINRGTRPLTPEMADRIIVALHELGVPGVTVSDLGAPEAVVSERSPTVLDRLQELAEKLAESLEEQARLNRQLVRLQARVRRLETRPLPGQDGATGTAG